MIGDYAEFKFNGRLHLHSDSSRERSPSLSLDASINWPKDLFTKLLALQIKLHFVFYLSALACLNFNHQERRKHAR